MMSNNVVLFPKQKRGTPPQTIEEVYENAREARMDHIEWLIDDVLAMAFQRCIDEGFDLASEPCVKSTALVIESMRAGLYKAAGLTHSLHPVADMMFTDEAASEALPDLIPGNDEEPEDTKE